MTCDHGRRSNRAADDPGGRRGGAADRPRDRLSDGPARRAARLQGVQPVAVPAVRAAALDGAAGSQAELAPAGFRYGRGPIWRIPEGGCVQPAAQPRRRRRRRTEPTGTVRVAWRAKGPVWMMKYRLPDETESMKVLGPASAR